MDKIGIRICGTGGQGIVLLGRFMGLLYTKKFSYVAMSASYGPEARGTSTRSEIVAGNIPILYPRVTLPDYLIILAQKAYDKYIHYVRSDTTLFFDSSAVTISGNISLKCESCNAIEIARGRFGAEVYANMVMLGFFLNRTGIFDLNLVRNSLQEFTTSSESFKRFFEAIRTGFELG